MLLNSVKLPDLACGFVSPYDCPQYPPDLPQPVSKTATASPYVTTRVVELPEDILAFRDETLEMEERRDLLRDFQNYVLRRRKRTARSPPMLHDVHFTL